MHLLEFVQLVHGFFMGLFRHLGVGDLLRKPTQTIRHILQLTQFLPDYAHLFLEEKLPLRLVYSFPDFAVELVLDFQDLQFRGQNGCEFIKLFDDRRRLDKPLLDLGSLLYESRHGVHQALGVIHVLQGQQDFVRRLLVQLDVFRELIDDRP